MSVPLAIIVHGGAWYIPCKEWEAHKAGCRAAAIAGFEVLERGGDALDAVETAIVTMEDDPTFDAGVAANSIIFGFSGILIPRGNFSV